MSIPADQAARDRIRTALDTNLLVEAGAGSGKTTELVQRMVALVAGGRIGVDEIVAVTFTRKAAAELAEAFRDRLEESLRGAHRAGDQVTVERCDRALRDIDRGFIGTIHSFCARLLRERPIEAGVDPGFRELSAPEEMVLRRHFWHQHLERLAQDGDPILDEIAAVGLEPAQLERCFAQISEHPDVVFTTEPVERPDPGPIRAELEPLLERACAIMPRDEPHQGWDDLQSRIRSLLFSRDVLGWDDDGNFFEALAELVHGSLRLVQSRWAETRQQQKPARELTEEFKRFAIAGGAAHGLLMRWYAHRYPAVVRFAARAAEAYRCERVRTSQLTFQDLLVLAARVLRDGPEARADLARRYRYLLVDEFQDTDPIQAEVLFLLAADDPDVTDWHAARPRPGALFVVGDPKQSIYRFRRADIDIYNQVRHRFREFGEVIELVANFRSRPAIAEFVNDVFARHFPPVATPYQAAFARLAAQKPGAPGLSVSWYEVEPSPDTQDVFVQEEARRLAAWIEETMARDGLTPGDFLILTYKKARLSEYARSLEARNIAVQVTGAGVPMEAELRELLLLLRALADPGNEVLTVAALLGLFFGMDYEQLTEHALAGRRFRFDQPPRRPDDGVDEALRTLHGWWQLTRRLPADVAIARILDEVGLLPFVAAGELGETQAGALVHFMELVRQAGMRGETALAPTLELLEAALEDEDAEAPLRPGRANAVRVMNLHKAKGLQAPVVILAFPASKPKRQPERRIKRPSEAAAGAWMLIRDSTGRERDGRPIARPLDWDEHAAQEQHYQAAEWIRLLYVAATRAEDMLMISRWPGKDRDSPWELFYETLERTWPRIELPDMPPPPRQELEADAQSMHELVLRAEAARSAPGRPSWVIVPARAAAAPDVVAKEAPTPAAAAAPGPQLTLFPPTRAPHLESALAWGRAVHAALAVSGRGAAGAHLLTLCREILVTEGLPLAADDELGHLKRLVHAVESVWRSDLGCRIRASPRAYFELEFMTPPGTPSPLEPPTIVHGAMDVIFEEAGGWVIVDYKTDARGAAGLSEARRLTYQEQLDTYARAWRALTSEPVKECILWFTADGSWVVWRGDA
ncbi:MAG: UvrD-helicase domain-containing protein [Gemmatimonadetes bacterium]|nr:UvrD-helicase domain-containing protein [Gemmatimonadota bacterium]